MLNNISGILSELNLPPKCGLLNLDGISVFACYGASGGLAATFVVYVFLRGEGPNPFGEGHDLGLRDGIQEGERGWKLGTIRVPFNNIDKASELVLRRCDEMIGEANA